MPTGEDDIEVIASDLIIEFRGRIERGVVFGMAGGDWEITGDPDNGYLTVEASSEA